VRREVRYALEIALERRRERVLLDHMVWFCLPWYRKLARTLLGMRPEPL